MSLLSVSQVALLLPQCVLWLWPARALLTGAKNRHFSLNGLTQGLTNTLKILLKYRVDKETICKLSTCCWDDVT